MDEITHDMKILTEDQVIERLKKLPKAQVEIARKLRVSRSFVSQVLKSRRSRPTRGMLEMVNVEKRYIYVEKGTFDDRFAIPENFAPRPK